jgi:DNA-binding GntR family transcriptional regulator
MGYVKKKEGPKQEIAYRRIKAGILENEFPADTMLIEGKLCQMLGFSKTPIREALRRLASEGLVEFFPERGTFVSRTGIAEFIELFDVREALEGMAARLCAVRKDSRVISRLNEIIVKMFDELESGAEGAMPLENMEFEIALINGSANNRLIISATAVLSQMGRFENTGAPDPDRAKMSFEAYRRAFEAVKNGNAELAEVLVREQIRSVKEYQVKRNRILQLEDLHHTILPNKKLTGMYTM